jgi:hypothetical protein
MLFLLGLIIVIALAIALAPIILGVIGTMLALLFTALLYLAAGCPRHEAPKPTAAEEKASRAITSQLEAWEAEDRRHDEERATRKGRRHAR